MVYEEFLGVWCLRSVPGVSQRCLRGVSGV